MGHSHSKHVRPRFAGKDITNRMWKTGMHSRCCQCHTRKDPAFSLTWKDNRERQAGGNGFRFRKGGLVTMRWSDDPQAYVARVTKPYRYSGRHRYNVEFVGRGGPPGLYPRWLAHHLPGRPMRQDFVEEKYLAPFVLDDDAALSLLAQ